tara:strand:- start:542 stop:733 length:192 start_codon:yes stop_codon:yes gene_type:complete
LLLVVVMVEFVVVVVEVEVVFYTIQEFLYRAILSVLLLMRQMIQVQLLLEVLVEKDQMEIIVL